jgi:hypothetical protein
MFLLLARNPIAPEHSEIVMSEPVQPMVESQSPAAMLRIVKSVIRVADSEVKGGPTGKEGKRFSFRTDIDNLIKESNVRIPSRLSASLKGIRRLWLLDGVDTLGNVVYKSMVGDTLIAVCNQ